MPKVFKRLKAQPAAPIEAFARFQAGFLSSEDFHRFSQVFMDLHRFSCILIDFRASGGTKVRNDLLPL